MNGFREPAELSIHPAKKQIPDDWGKEDPRFLALVEDIRERGIDQPLLIDKENRVLEGRRRLRAAKQLQLDQVPVIVRPDQAIGVILNGLLQRGHYNKSQLAYLAYPLMQPAFEESKYRRLENLKNPNVSRKSPLATIGKTVEEQAARVGIERNLFFEAQKVHGLFVKYPEKRDITDNATGITYSATTFKEHYERRILDPENPIGLGAVVAGIAGSLNTSGKAKPKSEQLELFTEGFDILEKRFRYWGRFDAEQRRVAVTKIHEFVAHIPDDLREELRAALTIQKRTK